MTERTDSVNWQHKAFAGAAPPFDLPEHIRLEPGDVPHWEAVLAEFPRIEWTSHQLELAAMLARAMADLEREQATLRAEGSVVATGNGSVKANPRAQAVNSAAALVLSIRRSLAMNARARVSDTRTLASRRDKAKELQAWAEEADPSGLLAMPWREQGQ